MSSPWDELRETFADDDIEWRTSRCGKTDKGPWAVLVPYLTARAIMNRLDKVVGPDGWSDEYREVSNGTEHGLICRLTVNGISKEDGAGFSEVESIKGGFSDALKRTAVKFGMGRFLYDLSEVAVFHDKIYDGYAPKGRNSVAVISKKDGLTAWCDAPKVSEIMAGKLVPARNAEPVPESTPTNGSKPKSTSNLGTRIAALNKKLVPEKLDKFHAELSQAKGAENQAVVVEKWEAA